VLEVHFRHREPGFFAVIDEERDEGGHRVAGVFCGILKQLIDPFGVRYRSYRISVLAQPVDQRSEQRVLRAG
jgi:hypothetical protein